jgi:hypothetical protein
VTLCNPPTPRATAALLPAGALLACVPLRLLPPTPPDVGALFDPKLKAAAAAAAAKEAKEAKKAAKPPTPQVSRPAGRGAGRGAHVPRTARKP